VLRSLAFRKLTRSLYVPAGLALPEEDGSHVERFTQLDGHNCAKKGIRKLDWAARRSAISNPHLSDGGRNSFRLGSISDFVTGTTPSVF
jgi:hypothetical protein